MYSPFAKNFSLISADDLHVLREVSEGWFVEYKETLLSPPQLAKSVSSFANHEGGWLFLGIQESSDGKRTAGAYPGIETTSCGRAIDSIRDAIKSHLSPTPYFESRVISGPSADGSLPPDRAVIAVRIPVGHNPPYIHSSGRIYRRVADSAEPSAERDRAVIDLLVRRSEQSKQRLKTFLTAAHHVSEAERESSFVQLFFMQDRLGERDEALELSFSDFAELAASTSSSPIALRFDNVFTMSDGFVGRHLGTNAAHLRLATWEFYRTGSSVFTFPITHGDPTGNARFKYAHAFKETFHRRNLTAVLDANQLLILLAAAFGRHVAILNKTQTPGPVFGKARLLNIWRKTPFFDSAAFVQHVKKYGPAVSQVEETFAPPGHDPDSFLRIEMPTFSGSPNDAAGLIGGVAVPFAFVMNALGVPGEVIIESKEDVFLAASRSLGEGLVFSGATGATSKDG